MPTPPDCNCKRWRRKFMEAEHMRRKHIDEWENDIGDFSNTIADCQATIAILKSELKHARAVQSSQKKIIHRLQDAMASNGIPFKQTMMSIINCRATNDEICPLSLAPINGSPLPLSNEERPCSLVLNPLKPEYKCAQLPCGHRFNSLWLIYHFVNSNTFRCPVCREGQQDFRFQLDELPPGVIRMLENVRGLKK